MNSGTSARSLGAERAEIRGAGIRLKTLAVVAVPMAFLLVLSAVVVGQSVNDTLRAGKVVQFAQVSSELTAAVAALQQERSAALSYLRGREASRLTSIRSQRQDVDAALATLRGALNESSSAGVSPALGRAVAGAEAAHAGLPSIRSGVDGSTLSPDDAQRGYGEIIEGELALPDLLADAVNDSELAGTLRAYGAISHLLESASQERDAIVVGSAAGRFSASQYAALTGSISAQDALIATLGSLSTPKQNGSLAAVVSGPAAAEFLRYRTTAVSVGGSRPLVVPTEMFAALAVKRLSDLRALQNTYAAAVTTLAGQMRGAALRRALLIAGLIALGLAFPVLHALLLSRRIVRPLRQLTDSAEQIRTELPQLVARMQQPGQDPDITIEPIQVQGGDEVARLARAFNTVNEVTVQVAIEQAALRGNISEMFVNVARRNQALLGRQLAFLDKMEADEEDPDVLRELFQLDHLAAQMRRNAESLLVLAGIDVARKLRAPMPISDVIRTATGEIEGFHRVDLRLDMNPLLTGLRALSVAHMLAELLDNATHFSNPQTRVRVTAAFDGDSVILDIYDDGLGLSPSELVAANHRLASPPATEIAVAQRLGFHVVGRIAQRLGVRVELMSRVAGGTVAVVYLPVALFVAESLPAVATPRDGPAVLAVVLPEEEPPEAPTTQAVEPIPAPVTEARKRRTRFKREKPTAPVAAPPVPGVDPDPAPTPTAVPVPVPVAMHDVPLAVQDILPGRNLRWLSVASPEPAAPPASSPQAAPEVAGPPRVPIPQPRIDASAAAPPATASAAPLPLATQQPGTARSALAELSQLTASPYEPASNVASSRPATATAALSRRTPKPAEEPQQSEPVTAAAPRSAEHVRGHLSGFRAGVERGRHAEADSNPDQRNEGQS